MNIGTLLLPPALLLLALAVACGGGAPSRPSPSPVPAPWAPAAALPKGPSGTASIAAGFEARDFISVALPSAERMVIRTINMTALVKDVVASLDQVTRLANELGGFVVSSYRQGGEKDMSASITLRVPAEWTDEALGRLRGLAVRVTAESNNAQDVTEEYTDLQARLKNLAAAEEQYLNIMKRAETVEDILKVQRELTNVRGEIERLRGRMQYLERTSATSLITVQLLPATSPEPLVKPGWSPLETAKDAFRGLTRTFQGIANGAIRLAVFSPIWVPILLILGFLLALLRRRLAHRS